MILISSRSPGLIDNVSSVIFRRVIVKGLVVSRLLMHPQGPHRQPHRDIKGRKRPKGKHSRGKITCHLAVLLCKKEKIKTAMEKHGHQQSPQQEEKPPPGLEFRPAHG